LFVANQEEFDLYSSTCPNVKIVIGEIGIKNQRNFISKYYDDNAIIISMDDDIKSYIHKDNKSMKDWLNDCIQYLSNSPLGLITFQPTSNPFFNNKGKEFSTGRYLAVGMFHIYKNDKSLILTTEFIEDYERSIQYLLKYGANIRYGWVYFKTKYWAKGGCSETRNRDTYLSNVNKILYMYPNELSYNIKKSGPMKDLPNVIIRRKSITQSPIIQLPSYTGLNTLYDMIELSKNLNNINNNK
jgi:ribulose bisphosphate carboxylase small subunit